MIFLANQITWPKGFHKVFTMYPSDMALIFWPQECQTFELCLIPRAVLWHLSYNTWDILRHSGDNLPVEANLSTMEFQTL